ncbi:MAG: DNA modification methylase [Actinomycetota bacterium]|nr:DNA modification methylase [Actinomycetota bacterium]
MSTKTIRDRVVELRRVRAGELLPNPRNWRRHPKPQREALRALLSEVGFADAILARELQDGSLEIIDGHLRQSMDAQAMVPVLVLDVDQDEADKLLATLDPLAAMAIADPEPLRTLLESVKTSSEDVRMLLAGLATAADVHAHLGLVDPDEIPEPSSKPRAKAGDVFALGEHRLICGDARDPALVGRLMGKEPAQLLLTDPPWGVGYSGKTPRKLRIENDEEKGLPDLLRAAFASIDTVLAPGAPIYLFHPAGPESMLFTDALRHVGWQMRQGLVWVKDSMVLGHADHHYRHEAILYAAKPGKPVGRARARWYGGHAETSVFEVPRPKANRDHPTAKPVELVSRLMANSSTFGDVVLDPFLGSGSSLIAAERLSRRLYGVEIDLTYLEVAIARWEAFTGKRAKKKGGNR